MPSLTVENYLKAALQIGIRTGNDWISTGELADAMSVSPGTVTSMLKTLDESDLVEYRPYSGAKLSPSGRLLAVRMLRRHRLIELFLVDTLGLSWDQVHEEAENMEHAVSDMLIDRIDDFLGRPDCDPHGDPIPDADGEFRGRSATSRKLSECRPGESIRLVRVTDQGSEFLRFLSETGLEIGTEVTVIDNEPEAEHVTVRVADRQVDISRTTASVLLVETVEAGT